MIQGVCIGPHHLHRHHRRSRRIRKDGKANHLSNLMLVCFPCHDLIHHERKLSTSADPDRVPW
jgi:predicted HNH restriction endonuclease